MGAIGALAALRRRCRVELSTDSIYVRDGITKWVHGWQKNGWKTAAKKPVANADLWQRLIAEAARHQIDWLWVKGHAGHGANELADRLARDAALAAARGRQDAKTRGRPASGWGAARTLGLQFPRTRE